MEILSYMKLRQALHMALAGKPLAIKAVCMIGGVFTQRTHGANYYGVYPGNTPENHPPTQSCMVNFRSRENETSHVLKMICVQKRPSNNIFGFTMLNNT